MEKIHQSITINAPAKKVWETMLNDATYREWTEPFGPGGYFQGSWEEDADILFLAPSEDGNGEDGMVARIKENRPYTFLSIEHLGIIQNGIKDLTSEKAQAWAPAYENYSFTEKDGQTELTVDVDIDKEFKEMFEEMWPKALQKLKELAER